MVIKIDDDVSEVYQVLNDYSRSGKKIQWKEKKEKTILIANSFKRIGDKKKASRLIECGTFLEFKRFIDDNSMKLIRGNFCKCRLCCLCSWRRSLKVFGQVSKIMNLAIQYGTEEFIFLTLTIKNCKGEELSNHIDLLMNGYDLLFKKTRVKKAVLGSFRALEITHNVSKKSNSFDTFHPHLHCILQVSKDYFDNSTNLYITQNDWKNLWKKSVNLDYEPLVYVEKINNSVGNISKSIAEIAKYTVKDSDILSDDLDLQDKTISVLDKALANRRLISFRGTFAKIQKQLNLDDVIDGDLVNCDLDESVREDLNFVIERYRWSVGYKQYIMLDENDCYVINKKGDKKDDKKNEER